MSVCVLLEQTTPYIATQVNDSIVYVLELVKPQTITTNVTEKINP